MSEAISAGDRANEVLVQLLERAVQGVDAAVEFSQAEIPIVVMQLLTWNFVENFLFFLVGVALYAVAIGWVWWVFSHRAEVIGERDKYGRSVTEYKRTVWHDSEGDPSGIQAICIAAVLPFLLGTLAMNITWLKIWIAPKLYLLEYGASLIK